DARYLVVKVDKSTIVQLNNKVKFPRGQVVMVGTWADCFWHVRTNAPKDELQKSATGNYGHASATGDYGEACVLGQEGKARASANGSVILTRWDGKRFRHVIGYVGEDGIKADTWYHLENGSLAEIKE